MPGRARRTILIASSGSTLPPDAATIVHAAVSPVRPSPPLQWITTRFPSSKRRTIPLTNPANSSEDSGTEPSATLNVSHSIPCVGQELPNAEIFSA